MTGNDKLELIDWIADQDRLRIETWHYMGGRQEVSVWTIYDEDDSPSGKAPTTLEALRLAKEAAEYEETR